MHCNGKCHLKRVMDEKGKRENNPVNNLKEKYEMQLFAEFETFVELSNIFILINHHSFYSFSESSSHLLSVFHPPSC